MLYTDNRATGLPASAGRSRHFVRLVSVLSGYRSLRKSKHKSIQQLNYFMHNNVEVQLVHNQICRYWNFATVLLLRL